MSIDRAYLNSVAAQEPEQFEIAGDNPPAWPTAPILHALFQIAAYWGWEMNDGDYDWVLIHAGEYSPMPKVMDNRRGGGKGGMSLVVNVPGGYVIQQPTFFTLKNGVFVTWEGLVEQETVQEFIDHFDSIAKKYGYLKDGVRAQVPGEQWDIKKTA